MTITLVKGQKADLTKNQPALTEIVVGMGWRSAPNIDVDFSAFLLSSSSKVTKDEDLIFYGNPSGANGSVTLLNPGKPFSGMTDNEQVSVSFRSVPAQYDKLAFALTIHEADARRQNFALVDDAYIRFIDPNSGNELIRYNLGKSFSVETAIVVGELYRYNGEWKFNAIGSGYSGGLAALCGSFGIEVKDEPAAPAPSPIPTPAPPAAPAPTPAPASPTSSKTGSPVNLNKIELKKRGDKINLEKKSGSLGEILINLNWNQKKAKGWFGSKGVDLDLGCLFELQDGSKGCIQALGSSFGALNRPPFIALDGDDRTGAVTTGENLRINGQYLSEFKRIVVFALIYEGVTNWAEADGIVTLKQSGGPDIVVRMDEHDNRKGMCAIAMINNVNNQTFSIEKLVEYYSDHAKLDQAYGWGLRWVAGSK